VSVLVVLLLASVVFLTTAVLVGALMLRGEWDKMGAAPEARDGRAPGARGRRAG
jgi:hypothetical protein